MFVVAALAEAESAEEDEERQASVQEHGLSWAGQVVVEVTGSHLCHISFILSLRYQGNQRSPIDDGFFLQAKEH